MNRQQDWITLHRVRFRDQIDGTHNPLDGPRGADAWRFYPSSEIGENGLRTNISDHWGGVGIYSSRAAAEAVFAAPGDHLPFLPQTVEAWHALVIPVSHRGGVNWRGSVQFDSAVTPAPEDPGGPLVVFTSAGYLNASAKDLPRMRRFLIGIDRVLDFYASLPGNIRRAVFDGFAVDGLDGPSVTLWRDDAAMLAAAYKLGEHRKQLNAHRVDEMFDHSSFTRGRIIASKGMWDGADPVAQMA